MHGDEPTATAALLDIFNFLSANDSFDSLRKSILQNLEIHFIPMLNPDGAARYQRENAFNIDLKSINDKFYKDICGAMVQPILEAIKLVHKSGKHLELTNLIIPSLNDSDKDIKELVRWIIKNLDKNVPLHFSAFYPCYKLTNLRATPPEKVIHADEAAKSMGMKNVHTGNI